MDDTMIKTIFLTASITLAVCGFVAAIFLNTILGVFNMAATSIATMNSLRASEQIVKNMKERHKHTKLNLTKQLVKRSSVRVGATASAAAISIPMMAVVAVAMVATGLEVSHYCDQQSELQGDFNVLYGSDIAFDEEQCFEASKNDAKAIWEEVKESSNGAVASAMKGSSKFRDEAMDQIGKHLTSAGGTASEIWSKLRFWLTK
jgi:hypothetical protein